MKQELKGQARLDPNAAEYEEAIGGGLSAERTVALGWPTEDINPSDTPAEAIERLCNYKAGIAARALAEYARLTGGQGESIRTNAGDFVTDLMHLLDALEVEFYEIADYGYDNHAAEQTEQ